MAPRSSCPWTEFLNDSELKSSPSSRIPVQGQDDLSPVATLSASFPLETTCSVDVSPLVFGFPGLNSREKCIIRTWHAREIPASWWARLVHSCLKVGTSSGCTKVDSTCPTMGPKGESRWNSTAPRLSIETTHLSSNSMTSESRAKCGPEIASRRKARPRAAAPWPVLSASDNIGPAGCSTGAEGAAVGRSSSALGVPICSSTRLA